MHGQEEMRRRIENKIMSEKQEPYQADLNSLPSSSEPLPEEIIAKIDLILMRSDISDSEKLYMIRKLRGQV